MKRVLTYAFVYGVLGATVGACVAIYTKDTPGGTLLPLQPRDNGHARNFPKSEVATVAETPQPQPQPQTAEVETNGG